MTGQIRGHTAWDITDMLGIMTDAFWLRGQPL